MAIIGKAPLLGIHTPYHELGVSRASLLWEEMRKQIKQFKLVYIRVATPMSRAYVYCSFKEEFIMLLRIPKQISASSRALTYHPLLVCQTCRNRVGSQTPCLWQKAMCTEVGIPSNCKSLQPATVCVSVPITSGRRERLHVIEVLTCLRQE